MHSLDLGLLGSGGKICTVLMLLGKWKTQMCRNQSAEMEVQKPGSDKKSWLSVFSALLTHNCVC